MTCFTAESLKIRDAGTIRSEHAQAGSRLHGPETAVRAQHGQGAGKPAHVKKGFGSRRSHRTDYARSFGCVSSLGHPLGIGRCFAITPLLGPHSSATCAAVFRSNFSKA